MRIDFKELDYTDDGLVCLLKGRPFTGTAFELDLNGALICEMEFEDGLCHGQSREWHSNGGLRVEESYLRGNKHGAVRCWFPNGQLQREALYELAFLLSEKVWDADGTLLSEKVLAVGHPQHRLLVQLRNSWYR